MLLKGLKNSQKAFMLTPIRHIPLNSVLKPQFAFFGSRTLSRPRSKRIKKHPADDLDLKIPSVDDDTEWIRGDKPEYFQIRKKIRAESDRYLFDTYLLATEIHARRKLEQEAWERARPSSEDQFLREMDHENGDLPLEEAQRMLDKNSKVSTKTRELVIKTEGMNNPALPVKAVRQLQHLLPYVGDFKSPEEFVFAARSACISSVFKGKDRLKKLDDRLKKQQENLAEAFDCDCLELIEQAAEARAVLAKDNAKVDDMKFQELLRKWNGLKNDFCTSEVGSGQVAMQEEELKIAKEREKYMPWSEMEGIEDAPKKIEEVEAEQVESEESPVEEELQELHRKVLSETKILLKENFSLEEAQSLLSDESIESLVDSMKNALTQSHELLLSAEVEEMNDPKLIKNQNILYEKFIKNEKRIYLEDIKRNRFLDPAVRLRATLTDDGATKKERLARTFFEKLRKQIFEEREAHLKMIPAKRSDFKYLDQLGTIQVVTSSTVHQGLDMTTQHGKYIDRIVILKTTPETKLKKSLAKLFPENYNKKEGEIKLVTKEYSTKEMNLRKAYLDLSKMIYEAKVLRELNFPQSWEEYTQRKAIMRVENFSPKTPEHVLGVFAHQRRRVEAEKMSALSSDLKKYKELTAQLGRKMGRDIKLEDY